ncbi:NAD(P)-dependent oxidoreductase [Rhodoblastus sphagnicola]|uniref:NAD(P)-dependent oxidoreductase n=1 Tax=Rhodoblastus sphagnicola TaxID=333368 RepID=A0A2S6N998_9HYPH|nr:SDR family oxidoreductase [Rhodoblastus sphagnicola]MBB4196522.1 NAD(P)H dehydrogenase (quinone) [Rhodoblastus sphagnicola]PPQ31193.1 NAD(P)-dependent oxidoreductase [Rhodoblastus sphagnicola]
MSIAVTGATGHLGRLVIAGLKAKAPAAKIVALARSPEKAGDLGVEARAFDYAGADLAPALAGVETLLLISSSEIGQRVAQHKNVIAAAGAAGVRRLVYTSLLHADTSPISLAQEHRATEADIAASGLPFVILRNGWYTENYTAAVPAALANGALVGSAGEGRLSLATRADYAEAAAVVSLGAGQPGQIYELAGDKAVTLADLAAEIGRQSGRDIPYKNLPQEAYAALLKQAGLPPVIADLLAAWDIDASHGALFDDGRQLSALIGRPTISLAVAVRAALP